MASATPIIAPVSGVIDVGGPGFGSLADTINQHGLLTGYVPGVTDFDTYLATDPQHSFIFAGNEWFINNPTHAATVTYDFGAAVGVDRLALWNEESSGIGLLNLFYSVDNVTFFSLASGLHPTDNPLADYGADVFAFAATTMRYIRFEMSECPQIDPGSFESCAIGEVAFRSAANDVVPEPASLVLLGSGLLAVARRRLKKRA
jgi:hypothetical protein